MAFLRCRMFLRGDGITLCEGPSGRELWFQGMHCTRPDFKHLNHSTGDCACHSSKCPRFLFVSCSSRHMYHSNTSNVEGSIPAVGALTPRRPSSVWWVSSCIFTTFWWTCSGRVANQLGPKCASSSYQLECQWHSCRSKVQNFLASPCICHDLSRLHADLCLVSGIQCIHILLWSASIRNYGTHKSATKAKWSEG